MAQDIEIQGGVYIVRRHAKLLASGKKSLIVKAANFSDLVGRSLYAVSKNKVYAVIKLHDPEEISIKDLDKRREEHQITHKEQQTWFPYADKLYAYKFDVEKVFEPPLTHASEMDSSDVVPNVKIEKVSFVKIPVNELSPKKIQELEDPEITTLHGKLHEAYKISPKENSISDVVNAHIMCVTEMKRRGLGHPPVSTDDLDERTRRYEEEVLTKVGINAANPSPVVASQINSYAYGDIYKELKIDVKSLGCIMLDTEIIENQIPESFLYTSDKPEDIHNNGFVAGVTPHITLLFGLLESGVTWKKYVEEVLKDWMPKSVQVTGIGCFDAPKEEPYYCVVAFVDSPKLYEGHQRLQFLPHIDTFPNYVPHLTLAYIKKDDANRDIVIALYNKLLVGKELYVNGLNFGDPPQESMTFPYVGPLEQATCDNIFFRKIIYTDNKSQISLMNIKPGTDIGEEIHDVNQFIRVEKGIGKAILNDKSYLVTPGDAVMVPAHTRHNFINVSSSKDFKVYTIYMPPQHPADEPPTLNKPDENSEDKMTAETVDTNPVTPPTRSIFSAQHKTKKKNKPAVRSGMDVGTMEPGTSGTSE